MSGQGLRLGFLASRNGSSMRAIVEAAEAGTLAVDPRVLITSNPAAGALDFARDCGLAAEVVDYKSLGDDAADAAVAKALTAADVELVILSGFLRKLGPATLDAFAGRILNVHPSLLPAHGGHGMYGRRVHEAVHAAGDLESGASIHLVEADYDTGRVIAQARVALQPGDGPEDIERRVTALEPQLFVETLQAIVLGRLLL